MTFDWTQYFELAKELAGKTTIPSNQEAKLRSSVSRAYYAAHCNARNYLRDIKGLEIPKDGTVHRFVIEKFKESDVKGQRRIGDNLDRLRTYRVKADYDDFVPRLENLTDVSLSMTAQIMDDLKQLSSN